MYSNHRIFLAVAISPSLQEEILNWEKKLAGLHVRWLIGKNLHLTLVPPWYVDDGGLEQVKALLQNFAYGNDHFGPLELKFDKVAFGPNPREPRLVWAVGAPNQSLSNLRARLEQALSQPVERRQFLPHLTLARFRPEDFASFPVKVLNEKVAWQDRTKNFVLMESHLSRTGADYEALLEIPIDL